MFDQLTVVTSCRNYGTYLSEWAHSLIRQTMRPGAVSIFTHGSRADFTHGQAALAMLTRAGLEHASHTHDDTAHDFGTARNRAVSLARTEWVMHLDADDTLLPHAITDFAAIAPTADVISSGYILSGTVFGSTTRRDRVYRDADGLDAFKLPSICSGNSPFRKALWEQSPYRTDLLGAWDTALWFGFARLGARFRATKRAVFSYRQHADSIFNQRRRILGWTRVRTTAQLKHLRRGDAGVAIIVPRDLKPAADREQIWSRVRAHYERHHADWQLITGACQTSVWVKGSAIAHALNNTNADVLVIADADCIVNPAALRETVQRVATGAPWGMPHQMVYRANATMTARYCAQSADVLPTLPDRHSVDRSVYEGAPGGGIVVIRRVWYDAIGGIPYAFRGWGSEDRALACLANTLLGPCVRGDADLLHLYHVPQQPRSMANANLPLLRVLGEAARRGKDELVTVVYTLPNPGGTLAAKTTAPRSRAGTTQALSERTSGIRRRIP